MRGINTAAPRDKEFWFPEKPFKLWTGSLLPFPGTFQSSLGDVHRCLPAGVEAHILDRASGGLWSRSEASSHINLLEMWAVLRGFRSFCSDMRDCNLLVASDNSGELYQRWRRHSFPVDLSCGVGSSPSGCFSAGEITCSSHCRCPQSHCRHAISLSQSPAIRVDPSSRCDCPFVENLRSSGSR